jgi:hypothetical protein
MYEAISGFVLIAIGLALIIPNFSKISRGYDKINSPFVLVVLICGLVLAAFGVILVIVHRRALGF